MPTAKLKFAIDFDSTICERYGIPTKNGKHDFYNCPPVEDALEAIKWWKKIGHELYICTARPKKDWPKMRVWLKEHGFPRIRISNSKEMGTTAYIDDRAIRFTNWQDIRRIAG